MDLGPFLYGLLFMGLGLGLTHYTIMPNFNFSANNCPPHTLWPEGHIVCFKTLKNIILGLFPTMRPKIQLSAHDVEFQRKNKPSQIK